MFFVHFCPTYLCPIPEFWVPLGQKWAKMDKNYPFSYNIFKEYFTEQTAKTYYSLIF